MSFIESPRFPEGISVGATGGPVFSSRVFSVQSGQDAVIGLWGAPLHQFDVSFGVKSAAQLDAVKQIFWICRGQLHQFRYKDWNDYAFDVTRGRLVPVSTGVYQLAKLYTFGPMTSLRKLLKPVVGSVALYYGGTLVPASNYTIDFTTGLVAFGSSYIPGDATLLAASGEFDTPVRFKTDQMMASIDDFDIQSWGQIPLAEVRFPDVSIGTPTAPSAVQGSPGPAPAPPPPAPAPAPGPSADITLSPSTMSVAANALSGVFTVTLAAPATTTIHVTATKTGDVSNTQGMLVDGSNQYLGVTAPMTFNPGDTTHTFQAYSSYAGTQTITLTNDADLTNGSPATLTVTA